MCGLNKRNAERYRITGIALFLAVTFAACESSITLNLPEVKTLQKNILEQFSNIERVTMSYGEKSKAVCLYVYGDSVSKEEAFAVVNLVRDMAVQKDFQEGLIEAVDVHNVYLTPEIQVVIYDAAFTLPAYPDAPPDQVSHCRFSFCSSYYFSPISGDFSDLSRVQFIGYSEWRGTEKISEHESRDIFWEEIRGVTYQPEGPDL